VAGVVAVRDVETVGGRLYPVLPSGYSARYEDAGWYTVRRDTAPGRVLHAWLSIDGADVGQPGRAVFLLVSPAAAVRAWLRSLADSAAWAWTPAELRTDGGAVATTIRGAWPDDRVRDIEGGLVDPGEPVVRLRRTVGGYEHPTTSEAVGALGDV